MTETLYARLGGYDAIAAVTENLLSRLTKDPQLGRFWKNRGDDGVRREKQLLIDSLRKRPPPLPNLITTEGSKTSSSGRSPSRSATIEWPADINRNWWPTSARSDRPESSQSAGGLHWIGIR